MAGKKVSTENKITFAEIRPTIIQSKSTIEFTSDNIVDTIHLLYQF